MHIAFKNIHAIVRLFEPRYASRLLTYLECDLFSIAQIFSVYHSLSTRMVKSSRAGVGKTLYIKRREEELMQLNNETRTVICMRITIPLQEKHVNHEYVTKRLLENVTEPLEKTNRIFHIDIAHEVNI